MFCHTCGEQIIEGSSFCMSCGANVEQEQLSKIEESSQQPINVAQPTENLNTTTTPQNSNHPDSSPKNKSKVKSLLPILVPVLSLIIVAVVLAITFTSEQKKNDTVLELQKNAESTALAGDYDAAIKLLNEAMDLRPDYEVLQLNLDEINRAKEFSSQLDSVKKSVTNQDFENAEQTLSTLKEQANSHNGPLFANFQDSIVMEEERITIGKLVKEIAELNSVDALAGKLSILESMTSSEVENVRTEILEKIVQISNAEATDFLANGQFAEALNAVNKGLSYMADNEKLLSLKEQIEQEKIAYEEQAAEEDLHNRTAAVEITSFTATLEDNGDIFIEGTITSKATVPIYTIIVFYAVYDLNGEFLEEGYVYVEPDLLEPGDDGDFSGLIPGVNQEATVEIFNITWYFDQ